LKRMMKRLCICMLAAVFFWCGTVLADRQRLRNELIRLHVVAASDSEADQLLKLQVRDAVTESLRLDLQNLTDIQQAKRYLADKLPYIQQVAADTLRRFGCDYDVSVKLCREAFDTRVYDTFSLPAGVYESLRIIIGEGGGKNWWCVVFPSLCLPAASDGMADVAAGAGFPDALCDSLTGETGYQLRFGVLDVLGRLENSFFGE